jgi:hypothetical protein
MVVTEISQGLWYSFFGFSVIAGILLVRKALTKEITRNQREYYFGMAIFIIIHIVARAFYYIYDFIDRQELYWETGALIGIASVIFLLYAIERNIFTRTKFLLTILSLIFLILLLILPEALKPIVQAINTAMIGIFIPLIYIYVAYKSAGSYRKIAILTAIGILVFLAGQTAHMKALLLPENLVYFILSPTLMLVGGIIFLYGLLKTIK